MWQYDEEHIRALIEDVGRLEFVRGAAVFDQAGEIVGSVGDVDAPPESPDFKRDQALVYEGDEAQETIGRLVVIVDSAPLWEGLNERLKIDALILIVMAATLVGVSALGARIVVVRPIQRFRAAVERLRPENIKREAGDQNAKDLPPTETGVDSSDEIGDLARTFEAMADELRKSHVELENRVEERTGELREQTERVQLLHRLASSANEAQEFEGAIHECLAEVCGYAGWPVGHAYVVSKDDPDKLESSRIWCLPEGDRFATFRALTEETDFESGIGLPGRVLASGKPAWIRDIRKDPNARDGRLRTDGRHPRA